MDCRTRKYLIIALVSFLLGACSSLERKEDGEESGVNYTKRGSLSIDTGNIHIQNLVAGASNEQKKSLSSDDQYLDKTIETWAKNRLKAAGSQGSANVIIKQTSLKLDRSSQSITYTGIADVAIEFYDPRGFKKDPVELKYDYTQSYPMSPVDVANEKANEAAYVQNKPGEAKEEARQPAKTTKYITADVGSLGPDFATPRASKVEKEGSEKLAEKLNAQRGPFINRGVKGNGEPPLDPCTGVPLTESGSWIGQDPKGAAATPPATASTPNQPSARDKFIVDFMNKFDDKAVEKLTSHLR